MCGADKEIKLTAKEGCGGRRRKMKVKPPLNNPVDWMKPLSDRCYPVRESRAWARMVLSSRWHFQGSGRDNCSIQGVTPGSQQPLCDESRRPGWQNLLRTVQELRTTPNFPAWLTPWHQHSGSRTGGCLLLLRGYFSFSFWFFFTATGQKVVHRVLQQKGGCNTQTFRLKCSLLITCWDLSEMM